jgi:hypothetical protein
MADSGHFTPVRTNRAEGPQAANREDIVLLIGLASDKYRRMRAIPWMPDGWR